MTSAEPWRRRIETNGRLAAGTTAIVEGIVVSFWVLWAQGEFSLTFAMIVTVPLVVFNVWFVLWIMDPEPELRRRWRLPHLRKTTLEEVADVEVVNLNEPKKGDGNKG